MNGIYPEDHASEATRLMAASKRLRAQANDRNSAGSAIRARWDRQADDLMAQAQVHAALATTPTETKETQR